jgi:hypothetical protein
MWLQMSEYAGSGMVRILTWRGNCHALTFDELRLVANARATVDSLRALGNGLKRDDLAWVVQILRMLFLKTCWTTAAGELAARRGTLLVTLHRAQRLDPPLRRQNPIIYDVLYQHC